MSTGSIESYLSRAGRLDIAGIDFASFRDRPLSPGTLRCLRYMHDVEFHTVCYLRDLLLTSAHRDPEITDFLSCWVFEELWHGKAIAVVLEAHGERAGATRVAPLRQARKRRELAGLLSHVGASRLAGAAFIAVHMSWGAVNEWTTQAGYARLIAVEQHPTLSELVQRIMRQEGRHIDLYTSQAMKRLAADRKARRITRFVLKHFWRPVGSGVMPEGEVSHLVHYLFDGEQGRAMVQRIDRRVDRLPGLEGLGLLARAVENRSSLRIVA